MTKSKKLSVLFVSFEAAPFLKTGGLGDVAGALPKELTKIGVDTRLIMPKFSVIDEKKFGLKKIHSDLRVPTPWGEHRMNIFATKIPGTSIDAYFIDFPSFFHRKELFGYKDDERRFAFFNRAILAAIRSLNFYPDVIHANDWQTGMLPVDLSQEAKEDPLFKNIATIYTIHNLAYQGSTDKRLIRYSGLHLDDATSIKEDLKDGDIDMMFEGIANATIVSTVSPTYAKEILTKEYGFGMQKVLQKRSREGRLMGILNGIDTSIFNPEKDSAIPKKFTVKTVQTGKRENKARLQKELGLAQSDLPLFVLISRITEQKGFDILVPALKPLLTKKKLQVAILGTGDKKFEIALQKLGKMHSENCIVTLGFDNDLAKRLYAGADFFLMPSHFEPCGLSQMIAMRYGTLVVARKTGGLNDTVVDVKNTNGSGFIFVPYTATALKTALQRAVTFYSNAKAFSLARSRAMKQDWSWTRSAKAYKKMYEHAVKLHQQDLKK